MLLAHITSFSMFFVVSIIVTIHFLIMFLRHTLCLRRIKKWDKLLATAKAIHINDNTTSAEIYTKILRAELLLNNAIDKHDYDLIVKEVIAMGLNPEEINHQRL